MIITLLPSVAFADTQKLDGLIVNYDPCISGAESEGKVYVEMEEFNELGPIYPFRTDR